MKIKESKISLILHVLPKSYNPIRTSKEMSSEVKRGQNAGNIECLSPGGGASKNRVAQCH